MTPPPNKAGVCLIFYALSLPKEPLCSYIWYFQSGRESSIDTVQHKLSSDSLRGSSPDYQSKSRRRRRRKVQGPDSPHSTANQPSDDESHDRSPTNEESDDVSPDVSAVNDMSDIISSETDDPFVLTTQSDGPNWDYYQVVVFSSCGVFYFSAKHA